MPDQIRILRTSGRSSSPASGLTGSPELLDTGEPGRRNPSGNPLRHLRDTFRATLTGVPRVLRLVWSASPWLTVGMAATTLLSGLVPAATAGLARLLVNTVVIGVRDAHAGGGEPVHRATIALLPGDRAALSLTVVQALVLLGGLQFLVYAVSSVAAAGRNITQQLLQERVSQRVQLDVMRHAIRMDLAFFEDSRTYDRLRQAQKEATIRPVGMITSVFTLIQLVITLASLLALLIGLSPELALVTLVAPLPAFIADSRYGRRTFTLAMWAAPLRRRMDYLAGLLTTDTVAKEVKLFGLGTYFADRFALLGAAFYLRQRRLATARYLLGSLWSLGTFAVGALTTLYVALQAVRGRITLGDLSMYIAALASIQTAVQGIFQNLSGIYENTLYLQQLDQLLASRETLVAPERPRRLGTRVRGHVVFDRVSFSYPGAARPALTDVSLELPPGTMLAVVGRNGAGKSTLVKLLCRMYDPTHGRILLDGVDLRELAPEELRANIAAVFQDYVTYQATAAENIGLGDLPHLEDRERIEAAVARAGAGTLIAGLPRGLDTPLGTWFDRGVQLSGGQWQKIVLGRAFMRPAPVLLLDEPTAALDAAAEHELFQRLRELASGRTALCVSHRFSTVRRADQIAVLDSGRLIEHGSHRDLMDLEGTYAELFRLQASAYLEDAGPEPSSMLPAGS